MDRKVALLTILASLFAPYCVAQATKVPGALAVDKLQALSRVTPFLPSGTDPPLIIEKEVPIDTATIASRSVVLKSGSRLLLRASMEVTQIIADELTVEGPATIAWAPIVPPDLEPPARGKAANGAPGRGAGASGTAGADGEPGNPGFAGQSAPSLEIYVRTANFKPGARLRIELKGLNGGKGGRGQDGGDGGVGARGTPASSSFFDCKRGPGRGGDGGKGGNGGTGGRGGRGGDGGDVTVFSSDPAITEMIVVAAEGGAPGGGGDKGLHGVGGEGGPEGQLAPPFCTSANRSGAKAPDGTDGSKGVDGLAGTLGRFALVQISESQWIATLAPAKWQ